MFSRTGTGRGSPLARIAILLCSMAVIGSACASPNSNTPRPASGGATTASTSTGPKTLRMAVHEPIESLYGETANVAREIGDIFNASFVAFDQSGTLRPRLAEKIPSITDGDWTTAADGSMSVTWKLKPNLKWHDGTALTSEDFAFTVRMFQDRNSRFTLPRGIRFIDEVATPDPQTVIFKYRRIFNGAATMTVPDFPPVPRHLLEGPYAQVGAEGLVNSPVWINEWVGLGPFKLTNHVLGSQVEGEAFGDYALGRPVIDRVIIRVIPDVNTIVANLLAGELDTVMNGTLEAVHGSDLRRSWEAEGRGNIGVVQNRLRQMQLQFRDPALPWATDIRVRQAALYLMDRQSIVDGIIHGLTAVGDVAVLPGSPVFPILERRGITKYPFDRARGERMLDAAGWPRGGDGLRRSSSTGAVFTWNPGVSGEPDLPETLVIADGFKAAGIVSEPDVVPDSLNSNDRNEKRAKVHSITRSAGVDYTYWDRFLISESATQENRYRGSNTGGYTSSQFETMFGQWRIALEPGARLEAEADMHKLLADELAYLPLFYNVDVYAHRKGVIGPKPNNSEARNISVDIHTWKFE